MGTLTHTPPSNFFSLRALPKRQVIGRILFCIAIAIIVLTDMICAVSAARWINKPFAGFLVSERMKVDYLGSSHWTGVQAGLKYPDKILSVNGHTLLAIQDLDDLLDRAQVGDPITYSVEKEGRVIEVVVPTMRFTWTDFITNFALTFLIGNIYILLGVAVFALKPNTPLSWTFFGFSFLLGISNIVSFDVVATHMGLQRIYIAAETLIAASLLHLSLEFPEPSRIANKYPSIKYIPYTIAGLVVIGLEAFYADPSFDALYVKLYEVHNYYIFLGAVALIWSIIHAYVRSSSVLARARGKVILFGAAFAFPVPALALVVAFYGSNIGGLPTMITNLPLIIFPAVIAYAIARHNLFDVDVYIKRAVGYVMMTAIVAMAYFSMQTLISTVVLTPILSENAQKVYPILFALLVVFFFNPVNRRVQDAVDKMFFRKKFDYKETVASISNALTSLLNLNEIIKQVIHTVRREMFIDTAGVILVEPQKKGCQTFFVGDEPGNVKDQSKEVCIPYDDPLLALLTREKKLITKYDIAEDPRYADVKEPCGQRFLEMSASLAIPLIHQDEVKGVLALGYKKSGHFYTREDIDLLTTLANQGAVAIENAKLAEQMKKEETVRTNLARYLSPQIVDQIIQKDVKVNLGGDRKAVTVLFSDIRNFTTITETRPPDQLVQILNEYFTEMAGIIFENQGSLDKYIGDAIVAVFGSLIPLENTAYHAVTAAIQMMKRLPMLNEKWMKEYGFTMAIGIGINTGEVFLGNIGSPERMEFTVIGDTVNVASRFSGLAKPGQILITREALSCLRPDIRYKELPPTEVKGKTGKLEVFEMPYK